MAGLKLGLCLGPEPEPGPGLGLGSVVIVVVALSVLVIAPDTTPALSFNVVVESLLVALSAVVIVSVVALDCALT